MTSIRPEDLDGMKPETVALLRANGDLDHIPIRRDELRTMAPEDIARLHKEGRLNHLLNPDSGKPAAEVEAAAPPEPEPARGNADQGARSKQTHRVGREALRGLSADEIVRRHRAGELDHLIRGEQ